MTTRAQPVRIGPWSGGLNIYSDQSAVNDEDAVEITNFDVDIDGSLKSRTPIVNIPGAGIRYATRILGIYNHPNGNSYFIFSATDSAGLNPSTNAYRINDATMITITTTFAATAMVQYQNKAWLVSSPDQANNGGSWDSSVFTAVATQPKGISACVYKEQIYIATGEKSANPAQVYFSVSGKPTSWTNTVEGDNSGSFLAGNGDGEAIRKIYSYAGSVLVLKTRSTYVFAYESEPSKGQVQSISSTVGVDGTDCMCENDSTIYVLSSNELYAMSNWIFERLNIKVPFAFIDTHATLWHNYHSVFAMGDKVVTRYYDMYYVYNVKTQTFSQWKTSLTPDFFVESPIIDTGTGITTFYAGSYLKATAGAASNALFRMKDHHTATDKETFDCVLRTKVYNMNLPYAFKRMMWWGVDLLAKSNVSVTVIPITYGVPVYWKDLPPRTWAQMPPGTWGSPLDVILTIDDNADIKNSRNIRMFVRYIKSLRFRQIQYVLSSTVDGSTDTGPLQVYSVTAYIVDKQLVPKKIN